MTQTYVEWVNENPMRSVRYLRALNQLEDAEKALAEAKEELARVEALPLDQVDVGLKFGGPFEAFVSLNPFPRTRSYVDIEGMMDALTTNHIIAASYESDVLVYGKEYADKQKAARKRESERKLAEQRAKRDQEAARELEEKRKQRKQEMIDARREKAARALLRVMTGKALLEEAAKPIAHWSEEDVSHGEYLMYMLVDLLKTHERNVYRSDWHYSFPEEATQDYDEEITFSSIDVWVSDMLDQQTLPDIKIMYDVRWWRVTASFDGASYTRKGQGLMGSLVRALLPLLNSQWGRLIGPLT